MTILENEAVTLADGSVEFVARLSGRKLLLAYGEDFQDEMSPPLPTTLAAQSLWADVQALRLTLVPLPEQLTDPTEKFTAPDDARLYFIGALVEFMARRSTEIPAQDRAALIAQAQTDQADVLAMYSVRTSNETAWTVTPEE